MTSYITHVMEMMAWNASDISDVPSRDLLERILALVQLDLEQEDVQVGQLTS